MEKRLPKGWRMARLGEVCEVFIDGDWIESKDQSDSGIRLIQTGNVGVGEFIDKEVKKYITQSIFERLNCTEIFPSDILISRLPDPVGRACLVPNLGYKCITAVDCTIVRVQKEIIHHGYLLYALNSQQTLDKVNKLLTGTTRRRISRSNLGNISIPLPPLPTQKKIAEILEEADGLRKLRKQADEKMQDLIPSLFVQMFGDPATNPKGWKMAKIKNICEVVSGFGFPLELQGETACEVPFYKVSDMNLAGNEQYMLTHNNSLSAKKIAELKYQIFPSDTIIFPKIGAAIATNKKRLLSKPSLFDNNVMGLIPSDKINHLYLYYLVQGINISIWASESQPPSIRKSTVEHFSIPLPPLPLQQEFAARVEEIEAEKTRQADSKNKLGELFNSLMHRAFTGELVA